MNRKVLLEFDEPKNCYECRLSIPLILSYGGRCMAVLPEEYADKPIPLNRGKEIGDCRKRADFCPLVFFNSVTQAPKPEKTKYAVLIDKSACEAKQFSIKHDGVFIFPFIVHKTLLDFYHMSAEYGVLNDSHIVLPVFLGNIILPKGCAIRDIINQIISKDLGDLSECEEVLYDEL